VRIEDIGREWTPPDGLNYSGLRPVGLSAAGYAISAFAILFAIGSLALGFFLWNQSQNQSAERDRLDREGAAAEATVTRVWRTGGKSTSYRLSYTFEVGRQPVGGHSQAPHDLWRTLKVGDRIPVRYIPADPSVNHPASWPVSVTPEWIVAFVPASFLAITAIFGWMIRRQWRLLAEGRPAPGVVTKARRVKNQRILHYEFRTMDGAVRKGRSNARHLYAIGEPVCVLYDPERPGTSQVYPLPFVRLVR